MKRFIPCLCFLILSFHIKAQTSDLFYPKLDLNSQQYGLIDATGHWQINPQFKNLKKLNSYFYYGEKIEGNKYNYRLTLSSPELIKINYLIPDPTLYLNRFIIIQSYYNGPKGIMDIEGNEVLPAFYSNLWIKENYFIGELTNEVFLFNIQGKKVLNQSFKYIDIKNGYIYAKITDNLFPNKERFCIYAPNLKPITQEDWTIEGRIGKDNLVLIKTLSKQAFYINPKGEIQIKPNIKINYESPFSNGLAVISSKDLPKKYGFMDSKGKVIIPLEYDEVAPFQEKYAFFSKKENGKSIEGLINKQNVVIKIFPAKVISKSIYYDGNEMTYYLSNKETYDANGEYKEDENLIQ